MQLTVMLYLPQSFAMALVIMCTPPLEAQYGAVQTFFLETKPWMEETLTMRP